MVGSSELKILVSYATRFLYSFYYTVKRRRGKSLPRVEPASHLGWDVVQLNLGDILSDTAATVVVVIVVVETVNGYLRAFVSKHG